MLFASSFRIVAFVAIAFALAAPVQAEWTSHRGGPERTGCSDGKPGPKSLKVQWVHRGREQFVASPVADGNSLFVSGLGAFNTASFQCLNIADASGAKVRWSKAPPSLKLPLVSSPAITDGKLIFGDGMHQTDGASLHCLNVETGRQVWRLDVPGTLVHIECSPAVSGGKVYVGAGHGGMLCIDLNRVVLEGKEQPAAAVQARLDELWKKLQAEYEVEKKKDPDFAIPPSEDSLPRPSPVVLWQQGKDKWHIDASPTLLDGKLLATSAFLDAEKSGERVLLCLDASKGEVLWKTPLKFNPWSGASVSGKTILVGLSSIRFDPNELKGAKGSVVALNLADGSEKWKRDFQGGVISPVAAAGGLAVFTCTDGKVRAIDIESGLEKWSYPGGTPFFAGPAVAGNLVYAVDLKGVVHAIALDSGAAAGKLDVPNDSAVKSAGSVYGSPIVHGGNLYLATCNLETTGAPSVVVCIGDK